MRSHGARTRKSATKSAPTLIVACLLSFILIAWALTPHMDFQPGGGGWWMCIDYVKSGTLYGGQPFCAQGPVIFYAGYLLDASLGGLFSDAYLGIIGLASMAATFILLRKTLIDERLYHPYIVPLLYILTVYPLMWYAASMLATALLLLGFRLMRGSRSYGRASLAGIAFAAATFTKYTVVPAVVLAVAYELVIRWLPPKGLKARAELAGKAKTAAVILVIPVAAGALLGCVFPNIWAYTVEGHSGQIGLGLPGAGAWTIQDLAAAAMLALLAWAVFRGFFGKDTLVYPVIQLSMVVLGGAFILAGQGGKMGSQYMLPFYPFLIASFMALRPKSPKLFTVMVLICLVYPSIFPNPLTEATRYGFEREREAAIMAIEYGLHFIPPQTGMVLAEGPQAQGRLFERYGAPIDPGKVVIIPTGDKEYPSAEDGYWGPQLRKRLNITANYSEAYSTLTPQEERIRREVLGGKYSMVFSGPPDWIVTSRVMTSVVGAGLHSCSVILPNFDYEGSGRTHTILYFFNMSDCKQMMPKVREYYVANYQRLCGLGQAADRAVRVAAGFDHIELPPSCNPQPGFIYGPQEKFSLRWWDLAVIAALYLPLRFLLGALDRLKATDAGPLRPHVPGRKG